MKITKYLCMKEGCDYISDDQADAFDHMELGSEHTVAEIVLEDNKLSCHKLAEEGTVEIDESVFEE